MGLFKKIRKLFNKKLENLRERECDLKTFKLHQDLFTTLYKLKLVENAVNVGQKVPINDLKTCFGEEIKIDELLQKGPVVLKFYRGTWCNYCETDLAFLNENYGFLEAEGATAIAIATQPETSMAENARACNYRFHSVSDTDRSISKKFGLLFKIPEAIVEAYRKEYNVDTEKLLGVRDVSLPATYVINKNGEVVYASMNEDFRTRASIDEVIHYVKKAKQDKKRYFTLCEKEECKIKSFVKGAMKKAEEKWEEKKEERKEEKRLSKISFGKRGSIQSLTLSEFAKDPLGYCLQNPEFLESFKDYLNKTFCTENLLFYLETVDFHSHWSARTEEERRSEAQRIFDTFIVRGAELEVNLDDVTRELLVQGLKEQAIPAEFYEKSSREIYNLMEADSFSKWKRTRDYAVIWKREGSPDFLSPYPTTAEAA